MSRRAAPTWSDVQEPERNTAALARLLGWYADPRAHVISRFPILDPGDADGLYTFVDADARSRRRRGQHPPAVDAVRAVPGAQGLAAPGRARARADAARTGPRSRAAGAARTWPDRGVPVFLTGDFNSPSHLDWTPAVAAAATRCRTPSRGRRARRWPTQDSATPTATRTPTRCWTPASPGHRVARRRDRTTSSTASTGCCTRGRRPPCPAAWSASAATRRSTWPSPLPYPTDHRGVVSSSSSRPAAAPLIVSPDIATRSRRVRSRSSCGSTRPALPDEVVALRSGSLARRC